MKEYVVNSLKDLDEVLEHTRSGSSLHLGEILVEEDQISMDELENALGKQKSERGRHLGELLMEMGLVNQDQVNGALARKLGIPFVSLGDFDIDPGVLSRVPQDVAIHYSVLPLAQMHERLVVAMENPFDWEALEVLRFHANIPVEAVATTGREISRAMEKYYHHHVEGQADEAVEELQIEPASKERDNKTNLDSVEQEARKKPVVRLVNAVILQGISHGASDINVRPEEDRVNIYYRIDGKLQFSRTLHKSLLAPMVSRIKIIGRMDIAERRLPQDGHARVTYQGNEIDLRISCMPTTSGESVVLRILDKNAGFKPLNRLGLPAADYRRLQDVLAHSYGMFLVTGPTGSGKSTTLYAVLEELRGRDPHIITVEDPVEYNMRGVEQIQIAPNLGYTFAEALRHILRHDPDMVMVGEIRDQETAQIATKAALTGHLVLSTLHTNDAASTVTRLLDMGVEPYLLSGTLLGVMAQRLVRLNCSQCTAEEPVDAEVRQALGVEAGETFQRGVGCQSCNYTGYKGRAAVSELLVVTPQMARLISQSAGTHEVKEAAIRDGMVPLTGNALALARQGRTSLAEVFSVRLE